MATKTEILSQAEQIRTNNTANSNTPALVGGAIKDLITYVGDKTAAEISFAKGGTELESTNVQGALLELYNRVVTAMARAVSAIALAGTNTEELGALDRTVKKHTIAITNLQSALATDETDIETLQAQVGSISSSLVTMSADIVRAMDKAKAAYNMADNHEDIIPGLDAGIKNNLSKINKNIADISELAGKIAINVRDIAALVSKDSIHDADIASLQTYTSTIDTTFKAFKSTVEQWEAAATSLHNTLSADVNTLKTDVANLKSKKVGNGVQAQSDDIASEAITGPKLASNSVTTGKIAPNTILDNDINPSSFDDNLATSRKLADAKIVGDKLAGKVDKETGMSLIKSTAADALKFAKKNSSGNLDLEEYNDVCVSSLRFRDVHGDSKDLANLLENQNIKVGDLETDVTDLASKTNEISKEEIESEDEEIVIKDNANNVVATINADGADFKDLKSNGKVLATTEEVVKKQDKVEHLVQVPYTKEDDSFGVYDDDGNIVTEITKDGLCSKAFFDLEGNNMVYAKRLENCVLKEEYTINGYMPSNTIVSGGDGRYYNMVYKVEKGITYHIKNTWSGVGQAWTLLANSTTKPVVGSSVVVMVSGNTSGNDVIVEQDYTPTEDGYLISWHKTGQSVDARITYNKVVTYSLNDIVEIIDSLKSRLKKKTIAVMGDSIMNLMKGENANSYGTLTFKQYDGSSSTIYQPSDVTVISGAAYLTSSLNDGQVTANSIRLEPINSNQDILDNSTWQDLKDALGADDVINLGLGSARIVEKAKTIVTSHPSVSILEEGQSGSVVGTQGEMGTLPNMCKQLKRLVEDGIRNTPDAIVIWLGVNGASEIITDTFESALQIPWETLSNDIEGFSYRTKFYGAMRYCIEFLYRNFPYANIILVSPVQTNRGDKTIDGASNSYRGYTQLSMVSKAMKEVSDWYACTFFDATHEIGISNFAYKADTTDGSNQVASGTSLGNLSPLFLSDGLHPNNKGAVVWCNYLTTKLMSNYFNKK